MNSAASKSNNPRRLNPNRQPPEERNTAYTCGALNRMDAAVFGLIVADLIASPMDLRHPPDPGGLRVLETLELTTGGNVCNTGIAMARLGLKVAAAGMVGSDVLGNAIVERMNDAGLNTSAVFKSDKAQTSAT